MLQINKRMEVMIKKTHIKYTRITRSATERKSLVRGVIRDPRRRGVKSRRLGKVAQMHDSPSLLWNEKKSE